MSDNKKMAIVGLLFLFAHSIAEAGAVFITGVVL